MDALFSQFSFLANEALDDHNFDPSRIEHLLDLFEREAYASLSSAEAEHLKEADDAEASMREAEDYLDSLMEIAMYDFHRFYDEVERSSKEELSDMVGAADAAQKMGHALGSAATGASDKYMGAALASAMATMKSAFAATKIKKVHPS